MPLPVAPSHDRHGGRADDPGVFPGEADQEDPAPPRAWGAAPEPRDPRVHRSAPPPRAAHAARAHHPPPSPPRRTPWMCGGCESGAQGGRAR
jgi:hypothetical protein